MRLNDFHALNRARQLEAFAPPHSLLGLSACIQEEAGELAGCLLGITGEKKRKASKTVADALDGVADLITYASIVAYDLGCTDLESLLADTFNMVSERAGSRFTIGKVVEEWSLGDLIDHCNALQARVDALEFERSADQAAQVPHG
jgi:hypothetical protein